MNQYYTYPIILFAAGISQILLPWWIIAPICTLVCYIIGGSKLRAYALSFGAIFSLWYGVAIWSDMQFETPMSQILGDIFGGISKTLVYTLTATVGAIVAGFSGYIGAALKDISQPI